MRQHFGGDDLHLLLDILRLGARRLHMKVDAVGATLDQPGKPVDHLLRRPDQTGIAWIIGDPGRRYVGILRHDVGAIMMEHRVPALPRPLAAAGILVRPDCVVDVDLLARACHPHRVLFGFLLADAPDGADLLGIEHLLDEDGHGVTRGAAHRDMGMRADPQFGAADPLGQFAKKAIERKTGARGLRSILEAILLDTMFDLPTYDGVDEVVVDKDVVEGRKTPVLVYAKSAKAGKEDAA